MNEKHWVQSLYDTFMMRDLIGYAAPGSLLIMGLLCELGETQFLKNTIASWSGVVLLVIVSYVTATGLRLMGTIIPVLIFHRGWGLLGRATNLTPGCGTSLERLLWRGDETWLRKIYTRIPEEQRRRVIDREDVFGHVTGLTGMALLVLAVAVLCFPHDGLPKVLCLPKSTVVIVLVLASIVFLLGHYRHAHQEEFVRTLWQSPCDVMRK